MQPVPLMPQQRRWSHRRLEACGRMVWLCGVVATCLHYASASGSPSADSFSITWHFPLGSLTGFFGIAHFGAVWHSEWHIAGGFLLSRGVPWAWCDPGCALA